MKHRALMAMLGLKTASLVAQRHAANYHSAEDLENEANRLSNFDGGYSGYNGHGDDFLDFAGQGVGFADAVRSAKPFILTLTNSAGAARTARICPGLIANAAGLIATGAFNDKSGAAGLSGASGSPGSIEMFNNFIRQFPSLVSGFKLATDSVTQMDQNFTIFKESPFQAHSSKVISTGIYTSEQANNTKILTVPEPFFMDSQTVIEYTVLPNTSITITLMVGVSLNVAKALRSKATTAKVNLSKSNKFIG